MNIEELTKCSIVPRYDAQTGEDYQRPPLPSHYRKIAQYFLNDKNPILPSAIIAAIGSKETSYDEIKGELSISKKLRIVDGQHRIEGIKALLDFSSNGRKKYEEVRESFKFPVIIMEIEPENEIVEIDAFINLNSKGKRVKTDLAEALKAKIINLRTNGKMLSNIDNESISAISMDIVRKIGRAENGFWKDIIIMPDENGKRSKQPISSLAFQRAIKPVVTRYLSVRRIDEEGLNEEDIKEEIIQIINDAWSCVIKKWKECFSIDGEYDDRFNICKGIGVVPLFNILADKVITSSEIEEYKDKYSKILSNTEVKSTDWYIGGTFSGLSSQSGFKRIEKFILGEISREELYGDF